MMVNKIFFKVLILFFVLIVISFFIPKADITVALGFILIIGTLIYLFFNLIPKNTLYSKKVEFYDIDISNILWSSNPSKKSTILKNDIYISILGAYACFVSMLALVIANKFNLPWISMLCVLLLFLSVYILGGRFILKRYKNKKTTYCIFDDKAIVEIKYNKKCVIYEISLKEVKTIFYEVDKKGLTTIFFNAPENIRQNPLRYYTNSGLFGLDGIFFTFYGLENGESLLKVLRKTMGEDIFFAEI